MQQIPFPRVTVPGIEVPDEIRAIIEQGAEHEAHVRRQQTGIAQAMLRLGKPIFRRARKAPARPSAHVRRTASARARSSYLKGLGS